MKRYISILTTLCFSIIYLTAQPTIDWQKSFGGVRLDKINAVIRTTDNGYLLVGQTASVTIQGRLDSMQAAVIRLNSGGGIVWQRNFGGSGQDVAHHAVQLTNGGFAIVGESTSRDIKNQGGTDGWIFTIESGGALIRQTTFGGTSDDVFKHIALKNDSLFVVGYSASRDVDLLIAQAKGGKDVLFTRFSSNELIASNVRLYGGSGNDEGVSFHVGADNFTIIGSTTSNNNDVSGNRGASDIWAFQVNNITRSVVWQRCYGGKNDDFGADIIQNTEGGYLMAGTTASNDGDVLGFKGGTDIWTILTDAKGVISSQNTIGGLLNDKAASIVADTVDKTYVILGSTQSSNGYVLSQHGKTDWSLSKIDGFLRIKWHKCLGGSEIDESSDIVLARDGGLLAVGVSNSRDGNVHFGEQNGNGWVVKLNRKNLSFYDDRQMIVKFRTGFTRDSALFYQRFYKARQVDNRETDLTCAGLMQLWQVDTFPVILPNGDTLDDIVEMSTVVLGKPEESNTEPNYAFSNGINVDSLYNNQRFPMLQVYGQDSTSVMRPCERIGRDSALILAIIDSGIDSIPTGHPLLQKYLWRNLREGAQGSATDLDGNGYRGDKIGWDFVENDAYPYDTRGHGSHVTGIIAQMLDRHRGDSVKIMTLRIFDGAGNSSLYNLARALTYAICNNAQVVNMSLSYTNDAKLVNTSVIKSLIDFGGTRQKLLAVAAAGNDSTDLDAAGATERYCPAYFNSANLLVVASVNPQRNLSNFSNWGRTSVDVAAPGDLIFSTLQNNKWGFLSGTSMATPVVSASAAMIGLKRCTNAFDFAAVKNALENTVTVVSGLSTIRKSGFVNFCTARQNYLNTLPAACLVSVKETPSLLERFSAKNNPFSTDLTVFVDSKEGVVAQMTVTDAVGKQVLAQQIALQMGENIVPIETDALQNGIYFVSLRVGNNLSTIKVVKI